MTNVAYNSIRQVKKVLFMSTFINQSLFLKIGDMNFVTMIFKTRNVLEQVRWISIATFIYFLTHSDLIDIDSFILP